MDLGPWAEITRWRFPASGGANSGRPGRRRRKIESISGCLRSPPQAPLSLPSKPWLKPSGDRRDKAGAVVDRRSDAPAAHGRAAAIALRRKARPRRALFVFRGRAIRMRT